MRPDFAHGTTAAVAVLILMHVSTLRGSVPVRTIKLASKGTLYSMCRRAQLGS